MEILKDCNRNSILVLFLLLQHSQNFILKHFQLFYSAGYQLEDW